MGDVAILAEGLGKLYRIGRREPYYTLRDAITRSLASPFRRLRNRRQPITDGGHSSAVTHSDSKFLNSPSIWALKDVSFEIKKGEVVGIIGRNGTGKSTLLKILSSITEPTEGQVTIHGRVGSLLEVGTGFHPELTGRENIYLNGAIIGMKKTEINRKFDEIVDFAEIEKFLDTPVKHYSSGMYMRLAFSVAAHLESEILLVDEVLAVGDTGFQKKCMGKMGDVARAGRTVLFVSHNLAAITHLCARGVLLAQGEILFVGTSMQAVQRYTQVDPDSDKAVDVLATSTEGDIQLASVQFLDQQGRVIDRVLSGQELIFRLRINSKSRMSNAVISIGINDSFGSRVSLLANVLATADIAFDVPATLVFCRIPDLPLASGQYNLSIKISDRTGVRIWCPNVVNLFVEAGDFYRSGKMIQESYVGTTLIHHTWATRNIDDCP
jgi:lipopolysaccharide transport system ATP-binding protein